MVWLVIGTGLALVVEAGELARGAEVVLQAANRRCKVWYIWICMCPSHYCVGLASPSILLEHSNWLILMFHCRVAVDVTVVSVTMDRDVGPLLEVTE